MTAWYRLEPGDHHKHVWWIVHEVPDATPVYDLVGSEAVHDLGLSAGPITHDDYLTLWASDWNGETE